MANLPESLPLELLSDARRSRAFLTSGPRAQAPAPMRDCAAHLLWWADDMARVQQLALGFIRDELGCDRVDIGPVSRDEGVFRPEAVSMFEPDVTPTTLGLAVPTTHTLLCAVLREPRRQHVFRDVAHLHLTPAEHELFDALRIRELSFRALHGPGGQRWLVCADQARPAAHFREPALGKVEHFMAWFLEPILGACWARQQAVDRAPLLSAAEWDTVRQVARGLSSKQVAARKGVSVRTVDNQLNAARRKWQVRSTRELLSRLAPYLVG